MIGIRALATLGCGLASRRAATSVLARALATQPGGGGPAKAARSTAEELERDIDLKQDLAAHAEFYPESGMTDPRIITGEAVEEVDLLERLPEDLRAGAGLFEETGISNPDEVSAAPSSAATGSWAASSSRQQQQQQQQQQQMPQQGFGSGRRAASTGNRTSIPPEMRKDLRRMAELYHSEFENSSSSEEVVASERGLDDPLKESSSSSSYPDVSSSRLADEVRAKAGRKPSSASRPRGGLESIPLYENEEGKGGNRQ